MAGGSGDGSGGGKQQRVAPLFHFEPQQDDFFGAPAGPTLEGENSPSLAMLPSIEEAPPADEEQSFQRFLRPYPDLLAGYWQLDALGGICRGEAASQEERFADVDASQEEAASAAPPVDDGSTAAGIAHALAWGHGDDVVRLLRGERGRVAALKAAYAQVAFSYRPSQGITGDLVQDLTVNLGQVDPAARRALGSCCAGVCIPPAVVAGAPPSVDVLQHAFPRVAPRS